jgi:hypothetical protein
MSLQTFTASIAEVEYHLVASILACPFAGVHVARSERCNSRLVEQDDLRWMYSAAETVVDGGLFPDDEIRSATLILCKKALIHFDHWDLPGGWTDQALVDFGMLHWGEPPIIRECAAALVAVHDSWAAACDEHGPMYVPPPALGQLNAVRTGFILQKLSRLSGIPAEWINHRFAEMCFQQDAKISFTQNRPAFPRLAKAGAA